jgi:hypothetical protein
LEPDAAAEQFYAALVWLRLAPLVLPELKVRMAWLARRQQLEARRRLQAEPF